MVSTLKTHWNAHAIVLTKHICLHILSSGFSLICAPTPPLLVPTLSPLSFNSNLSHVEEIAVLMLDADTAQGGTVAPSVVASSTFQQMESVVDDTAVIRWEMNFNSYSNMAWEEMSGVHCRALERIFLAQKHKNEVFEAGEGLWNVNTFTMTGKLGREQLLIRRCLPWDASCAEHMAFSVEEKVGSRVQWILLHSCVCRTLLDVERFAARSSKVVEFHPSPGSDWTIDLARMTQTSYQTGVVRRITRCVVPPYT
jgi:hypothetical protein